MFRGAALAEDSSRPLTSNVNGALITGVDVQGYVVLADFWFVFFCFAYLLLLNTIRMAGRYVANLRKFVGARKAHLIC
jgi:hypothetical protein